MIDPLLALCARVEGHPAQYEQLRRFAQQYEAWATLARRAEVHGIAPLVYKHCSEANIPLPDDLHKNLLALTLRHRRANQVRGSILANILNALKERGIPVLALKGVALAHSLYSEPGQRPMRDMDILVRHSDALATRETLLDLGFNAPAPQANDCQRKHHLPVAQRLEDGLNISVEVHCRLLPEKNPALKYDDLEGESVQFNVNGVPARTLGHEDMLWHIYRHSFALPLIEKPIRLIWVADFVSLVEKHIESIDWLNVKREYPKVWHVLPVFHFLTPWSDKVIKSLELEITRPPQGIGQSFQGWPHSSLAQQRQKGVWRLLADTFWPSEWWTQLYYGTNRQSVAWWRTRLWGHPLHIAGWMLQYLRQRTSEHEP